MPLEVIGAGFGRTGTNSLKIALEKLGYKPCHHMKEVFPRIEQINWFDRASKGEDVDWDAVFAEFKASVDWPSAKYHKELAKHFPQAKIILSTRDVDRWYGSARETIFATTQSIPGWMRLVIPRLRILHRLVNRTIWNGIFEGRFLDEEHAKAVYLNHVDEVKAYYPAERLLIHKASDGWQPLCDFLNKDVPDEPYPQVNEAEEIKRLVKVLKALGYLPGVLLVLAAIIVSLWLL